ncbi:hypothetical protein TCAL_14249 [Tigriopus californicus]|uniref:Uncharacterized protein n=2 Tax=Tigriopus californicus TaxID=6832 RepID=A0A553NSD6_TIGCA|nr:hypothetical protein TCAL_14249 [Tigriopus californicus]
MTFTREEKMYYDNEFKSMIDLTYAKCLEFFVNRLDDFKSYHETLFLGIPLTPEKMKMMMRLDEVTITSYCLQLDDCYELSFHDRMTLIKNNFPALYGLTWAGYGQDSSAYEYYATFLEVIKGKASTDDKYRPLACLAEQLLPSCSAIETNLVDLNEILPPEILRQESKITELNQETRKVREWCNPSGSAIGPDNNIILIFYKIILFGTEFSDRLDDPAKCGAIQDKYLWQLHRYVKTQFGKKSYALLHETAMIPLSIKSISNVLEEAGK